MRTPEKKIALEGGHPVRREVLPYGKQWLTDEEIREAAQVLRESLITTGPQIDAFENSMAAFCGAKYAVAYSSGTAALHGACFAVGVKKDFEAIVPSLTFIASANCALYCGGRVVLVDVDPLTKTIDLEQVEKRINKKTRVVIPVDFQGHPADLKKLAALARKHNLAVIEDASHSLGATYHRHPVGGIEGIDLTVFSFHPVKAITTGEGGMVLTNNPEFYEKLKLFRNHGISRDSSNFSKPQGDWYYEVLFHGYNYRLTSFQAALGKSQLQRLPLFIKRRREIAKAYDQAFKKSPLLKTPFEADWAESAYHLYIIELELERLTCDRGKIFAALRAENIGVMVHYIPIHQMPLFQKGNIDAAGAFPHTERFYERAITLPLFPAMTEQDVQEVIEAVNKVLDYFAK